jgi:hypothetical protein
LINSSLLDMDERVSFVEKMPSTSTCLNAETKPLRVDLSTFSPAFDLTLDLQCRANGLLAFGHHANGGTSPDALVGDDGGVFSGEDAGHPPDAGGLIKGGDDYSLWLYLPHGDKDAFGYFANVRNANTEDESVDFMFLENDSTTLSRIAAYRVKAKPKTKRFEFVYASTNGGGEAGENLRCGFRMISDGTYVWAVGTDHQLGTTCAESKPFTRCLLASDLSEAPDDSVCRTLDQQFTMGTPSGDAIATAGDAISAVLPITASEAVTSPF